MRTTLKIGLAMALLASIMLPACVSQDDSLTDLQQELPVEGENHAVASDDVSDKEIGNIINTIFPVKSRNSVAEHYTTDIIYSYSVLNQIMKSV